MKLPIWNSIFSAETIVKLWKKFRKDVEVRVYR